MAAHEDLIGGREGTEFGRAAADLGDAVKTGGEDDEDGAGDGLHHDGAAAALEAVEADNNELAKRGLEQQRHCHRNLRRQHCEQQLDHLAPPPITKKRRRRCRSKPVED